MVKELNVAVHNTSSTCIVSLNVRIAVSGYIALSPHNSPNWDSRCSIHLVTNTPSVHKTCLIYKDRSSCFCLL